MPTIVPNDVPPKHPMVTRSQDGTLKPNPKYLFITDIIPVELKSVKTALRHPGWFQAMKEELDALHSNDTWYLIPRSDDMNVVGCK